MLWSSAAPYAVSQSRLPALGDPISDDLSVGMERRLGDEVMREIRRDPDYSDDPLLLEYLRSVWDPLVAQARKRGEIGVELDSRYAWEPFLVRDPSINAFALPGGYVGVNLGLLAMTATPDELASVLAHELSHVTQRHIARSIANSKRQSLIGIASMIVAVLAASRNGEAANAAMAGGQAAAIQGQLNFSRDMEREADRIGFNVMTGAGFSPGGMAAMFEKLSMSSRLNDNGGFPYLRSHPLTTERIGEARARMGVAASNPPVSLLEHSLAQARARVLMDTRVDALRRWQSLDLDPGAKVSRFDALAAACSSALASTLLREWDRADAALAKAQTLVREPAKGEARAARAVELLAVQSLLARGATERATLALQPYVDDGSRPVLMLQGQIALAAAGNGNAPPSTAAATALRRSADELQTRVAVQPLDATAWGLLARVWGRLDQPLRALRADAESQFSLGDLPGAIDRLRAGQRLARGKSGVDFVEASVIDSRMRDIERQLRQQTADERKGS